MTLKTVFDDKGHLDLEAIKAESVKQIAKWGLQKRHLFEWLAYTTEEHGELAQAISEYIYRGGNPENIVKEAIQASTLSLKIATMVSESMNEKV